MERHCSNSRKIFLDHLEINKIRGGKSKETSPLLFHFEEFYRPSLITQLGDMVISPLGIILWMTFSP